MAMTSRGLTTGCDPQVANALKSLLQRSGLAPLAVASVPEAMNVLACEEVRVVFCAAELDGGSYRDLIRKLKAAKQRVPVVVVSRLGEWNEYLDAIGFGEFDCVAPPYRGSEVQRIIGNALQAQHQEIAISAGAR